MNYEEYFKFYTVEKKRADLVGNPFFDSEKIINAKEEVIIILHKRYFELMDKSMKETIGESIYSNDLIVYE